MKKSSFRLINQAIFNKFGICINYSKKFDIYAQIEAKDCIRLQGEGRYSRKRIRKSEYNIIKEEIVNEFNSFKPLKNIESLDGIHLFGKIHGASKELKIELSKRRRLVVYGMANEGEELGPLHHTLRMVNNSKQIVETLTKHPFA